MDARRDRASLAKLIARGLPLLLGCAMHSFVGRCGRLRRRPRALFGFFPVAESIDDSYSTNHSFGGRLPFNPDSRPALTLSEAERRSVSAGMVTGR